MVADLDGENVAFGKDVDVLQQITRALFDLAECPETSPLVAKIAGASRFRASVFSHSSNNGSEDFIACAKLLHE